MRQSILAIFIFSSLFINSSISNELKAQTVTTTIQYGGFVTTCCSAGTVDYFCFDSPSNTGYCGNTTTCNTQNFTDPVPAGNIVTQIAVSYTSAGCGGGILTGSVNGTSLGSVTELNNGCPCTGLQWTPTGATTSNYPCGIVNAGITYNYGGLNSFQFCAAGQVCIDRAVLTISYVPASQASPATQPSAISGTTPICVGTAQNYSIPTVANAASYVWTVPAGWTINSGQGTTGINATSGSSGNICVTATNLCGTSAPTCYNVNVLANVNAGWTNPSTICAAAGSINLNSLITGTGGGTWSGTGVSGTTFSPSSGTQSVTYTVGIVPCQQTSTQTITVVPDANPAWTNPSTICAAAGSINLNSLITGTGGGTWSGTGVSGNTFNPSSGTQSITYTVGAAPCQETSVQTITVVPDVNPAWTNPSTICESAGIINLNPLITGTGGGTWSGTGVSGNTFNPSSGTQSVTYTVGTAPCQETSSQTITVAPNVNSGWTPPSSICANAGSISLTPLITGVGGGTWSGTGVTGTNFNPTGLSGNIAVTYTVGTVPCQSISVQNINVTPDVDPTWTNPSPVCEGAGSVNLNSLITGTVGGTWSGTGVTGTNFDPIGLSGNIAVTYTVGAVPCQESLVLNIQIDAEDDATFAYSPTTYCLTGSDPLPSSITTSGGTFTISGSGSINPITGLIDLSTSGVGTFTITYNTVIIGNPCPNSTSIQVIITTAPTAVFSYDQATYCQDSANPVLTFGAGSSGGIFLSSPTGLSINSSTGAIDLLLSSPGLYTVIDTIAPAGGCAAASSTTVIEVLQVDSALFSYASTFCLTGVNPLPTMGGNATLGGTFTISAPGVLVDPLTGEIDLVASGLGTFTVFYNTTIVGNACSALDSFQVIVNPLPVITITNGGVFCKGEAINFSPSVGGTWSSNNPSVATIDNTGLITGISLGTATMIFTDAITGCQSDMSAGLVTVNGVVAIINATPLGGAIPLNVTLDGTSSTGNVTGWLWDFGDGSSSTQSTTSNIYPETGMYTIMLVVTDGSCTDTAYVTIDAFGESAILIPNVFTPNGDGQNDVFIVEGVNLASVEGEVFNRWGQKMFSWSNIKGHWDGRTLAGEKAPEGTYFYIIKALGIDGEEYFKKGGFSLIR